MIHLEKEALPTRCVDIHLDENLHSYYVSRDQNEKFALATDVSTNTFRSASQWMTRALEKKKNASAETFLIEEADECYIRNVNQVFEKNAFSQEHQHYELLFKRRQHDDFDQTHAGIEAGSTHFPDMS